MASRSWHRIASLATTQPDQSGPRCRSRFDSASARGRYAETSPWTFKQPKIPHIFQSIDGRSGATELFVSSRGASGNEWNYSTAREGGLQDDSKTQNPRPRPRDEKPPLPLGAPRKPPPPRLEGDFRLIQEQKKRESPPSIATTTSRCTAKKSDEAQWIAKKK
jgi:hypothetical protein